MLPTPSQPVVLSVLISLLTSALALVLPGPERCVTGVTDRLTTVGGALISPLCPTRILRQVEVKPPGATGGVTVQEVECVQQGCLCLDGDSQFSCQPHNMTLQYDQGQNIKTISIAVACICTLPYVGEENDKLASNDGLTA